MIDQLVKFDCSFQVLYDIMSIDIIHARMGIGLP